MIHVTEEAFAKLQEIAREPGFDGKAVRIRPVGIT